VDTITREDYANLAFVDVTQGLEALVPGLSLRPKNGPFDYADISLQGSRTADVLWLVDGVRINNRLYGSTPPLDTLPAAMVERVETLEGGQALFYGTSAVAGAVNIVTKSFTDSPDAAVTFGTDTDGGRRVNGYFRNMIETISDAEVQRMERELELRGIRFDATNKNWVARTPARTGVRED